MSEKKARYEFKKRDIRTVLGIFFLLFALLGYLAPSTHLWFFDYVPMFLFGVLGYYLFFFLIAFNGVVLFLRNHKIRLHLGARSLIAFLLILLGACALLSAIGSGEAHYQSKDYFFAELEKHSQSFGASYPFALSLGGGIFGYLLLLVFSLTTLYPLTFFFSALLLVVGLLILFYPQEKKLFLFLRGKKAIARSKRQREKEERAAAQEAITPLPENNDDLNTVYEAPSLSYTPELQVEEKPLPQERPSISVEESQFDSKPLPSRRDVQQIEEPDPFPAPPLGHPQPSYGLQEVFLSFGDDAIKSEPKKEETLNVTPSFLAQEEEKPDPEPAPAPMPQNVYPSDPEPIIQGAESYAPKQEESYDTNPIVAPEPLFEEAKPEEVAPEPKEEAPVAVEPVFEAPQEAQMKPSPMPVSEPAIPEEEEDDEETKIEARLAREAQEREAKRKAEQNDWVSFGDVKQRKAHPRPAYEFPPLSLLNVYPADKNAAQNEHDALERSEIINQALIDLHVGAHVENFTIGPSVTRYNIKTDPSVQVSAVRKVSDDIMVRLGGVLGLFQEVVPGSACSGLEIPNKVQSLVPFNETVASLPTNEKSNLFIPFGKSIDGKVVSADLGDFPHMLIAGSTGSGKSIFMHGMIMPLIMRNRPEDLKLVLVDPKKVEMGKYRDLPHLLCPIIKEPSHAKVCLDKLCDEMERRYSLFEYSGVSNIRQFNKDIAPSEGCEKLPFIIVVIDEYADLVDNCKDIGDPVVRLAQKARAAGIHLVIATQRPDVKVIDGRIKGNIATRVALSLSSPQDSMTILSEGGAEKLSGHGDMLVKCDQVSRIGFSRLQGCFVDNGEIKKVCDFIKEQQEVVYDPNFLDLEDHSNDLEVPTLSAPSAAEMRAASNEDKYQMIKQVIMTREYTSISQIQREFSVGFPRAGKIFQRLQQEGVVANAPDSPSSSKGCRVLIHGTDPLD